MFSAPNRILCTSLLLFAGACTSQSAHAFRIEIFATDTNSRTADAQKNRSAATSEQTGSNASVGGNTSTPPAQDVATDAAKARMQFWDTFELKGAGGENHLASAAAHGANVIRTWSTGDNTQALLDEAHEHGLKVILGIWMPDPHDAKEYRVKGRYQINYNEKRQEYLDKMQQLLDQHDDHPALLMWGLGNEVEYSVSFLKTVNAMSKLVHQHNPQRLTCHVSVNAKQIELFAEHAMDIDLYGANSYGHGSMRNVAGILEKQWGKKYFFAEYAHAGPWEADKTESGYPVEFPPGKKIAQTKQTFAVFEAYPNLVGGVYFLWGPFFNGTHTWFSGLLPRDSATKDKAAPCYLTPYTDTLAAYWMSKEVDNHAPIIAHVLLNGQTGNNLSFAPASKARLEIQATDPDNDPIGYRAWIFATKGYTRTKLIEGPTEITSNDAFDVQLPKQAGSYTVIVYAIDEANGKACAHQIPFVIGDQTP